LIVISVFIAQFPQFVELIFRSCTTPTHVMTPHDGPYVADGELLRELMIS